MPNLSPKKGFCIIHEAIVLNCEGLGGLSDECPLYLTVFVKSGRYHSNTTRFKKIENFSPNLIYNGKNRYLFNVVWLKY